MSEVPLYKAKRGSLEDAAAGAGVQGYLAHKKQRPPQDPTVGLCLGTDGGPLGPLGFSSSQHRRTPEFVL